MIDSQSIKTSAVRGLKKASIMGKKSGDASVTCSLIPKGNLMEVKVTGAGDSDLAGGKKLLEPLKDFFPVCRLLWGDSHYGGTLIQWVEEHLGWNVEIVRGLGTVPDADTQAPESKEMQARSGFKLQPRRWVVERSFAWIIRWRRLCRDHEGLPESSEAFIKLSATRRMLSHLA